MNKFFLMLLLMLSFSTQAEDIRGDNNHDGVLSGEEQFLRDNQVPPPEPKIKKTAPRTMPSIGVVEIDTGYGVKGWIARADGKTVDDERLKYLQADILHASSDGYKQRTAESNAIVEARSQRNTITRIIEQAQRENINLETLLWRLKIEGYKHIMSPITTLENVDTELNRLQKAKEFDALMRRPRELYKPTPYAPAPVQSGQPYYYPQSIPYHYAPQQESSIIPNQQAPIPTVRNGQLEYYGHCNLPTVRNGRLECQ